MRSLFKFVLPMILAVCLTPQHSYAQQTDSATIAVKEGGFADITVKVPKDGFVLWLVYPPPAQRATGLPKGRLIFGGSAGKTYNVTAAVIAGGESEEYSYTVTFAGTSPVPVPPNPNPPIPVPPTPNPPIPVPPTPVVTDPVWAIVVEETANRSGPVGRVLGDVNFWRSLPVAGWRFYDVNSPDTKAKKYDQLAEQEIARAKESGIVVGYPVLMLVKPDGSSAKSITLPLTTDLIRSTVKEVTGK